MYQTIMHPDITLSFPAFVGDWVSEAGNRIWIVQIVRENTIGRSQSANTVFAPFRATTFTSSTLNTPTTLGERPQSRGINQTMTPSDTTSTLPWPSWWNGTRCDTYRHSVSYPLGTSYRGVDACGPIPLHNGGDLSPLVTSGAEWECVELSMRYMNLAYGIAPYRDWSGGGVVYGRQVVSNYTGSTLQQILVQNNVIGSNPISPGDIISTAAKISPKILALSL